MQTANHRCELCGELMPASEAAFRFHGYSGPCPKPPLPQSREPFPGEIDRVMLAGHVDSLKDELAMEREAHRSALNRCAQLRDINKATAKVCEEAIESHYAPDPNCSCHISPPCSDCVEYGGIRETVQKLREDLAAAIEGKA